MTIDIFRLTNTLSIKMVPAVAVIFRSLLRKFRLAHVALTLKLIFTSTTCKRVTSTFFSFCVRGLNEFSCLCELL